MQTSQIHCCRHGSHRQDAQALRGKHFRPRPTRHAFKALAQKAAVPETRSSNGLSSTTTLDEAPRSHLVTGSSDLATAGPAAPLVTRPLLSEKTVVFLRHGQTTWNLEKRIQGDSDISVLTPFGQEQARRTRTALSRMPFDSCFCSPITRARTFAELAWAGRSAPLIHLDTLREAHLGFLQGMTQEEALATTEGLNWRKTPSEVGIGGRYPVKEVFAAAQATWKEVLEAEGSVHLLVTHKSILRAHLCVALGLPPSSFRAFDVNNGGICTFRVNTRGEPMLNSLNLTSHLNVDNVYY